MPTIRSFENGKHVLLEKPMAHDLNSALKILKHSKRSGNVFMIAENSQYWPEVNCVHDLLQEKAIGEIITVRASFRQNTSSDIFDSYNLLPGDQLDKAWRFDKKSSGGGITLDGGAHWIRPMRIWCGNVSKTMAKFGYPLRPWKEKVFLRRFLNLTVESLESLRESSPKSKTSARRRLFGSPALWEK